MGSNQFLINKFYFSTVYKGSEILIIEETKSHRALVVKNKNTIFVTSNRRNGWIQERYFC